MTFSKDAVTDAKGEYSIEVDGDHEEELCEVMLVKSPKEDCSEISREYADLEQATRISLTTKNGIVSPVRQANPLGFLRKERLPICSEVFRELGLLDDGTMV